MKRLPACLALLLSAALARAADEPVPVVAPTTAAVPATAPAATAPVAVAPLDLGDGVRLELVRVPAGTFKMGSPATEDGRRPDEEQVDARVDADFDLGKFPVTRGQFARFVKATGHRTEAEIGTSGGFGWNGSALVQQKGFNWRNPGFVQADDHPVVLVTYNDAKAFCAWASRVTGRRVTLPTERQWELACRGGTTSRYYTGDAAADADRAAWHKGNAGNGTRPVGQKAPNPLGLFDLSGNVFEWCDDANGPYKPGGPIQGQNDGKVRNVLRGGSWARDPADVRSAARYRNTPGSRNADNGFRVAVAAAAAAKPTPTPAATTEVPGFVDPPAGGGPVLPLRGNGPVLPAQPVPAPTVAHSDGHTAATEGSGGVGWIACLAFAFVPLALIGLVVVLVRRMGRRASATFGGSTVSPAPGFAPGGFGASGAAGGGVRPAEDGFWIDTAGYPAGSVVRYSYRGPSGPVSQQFTVEPSPQGQFVYTGHRPHDLTLAGVAAAGAVGGAAAGYLLAEQERRRREEAEEAARRATRSSYTSHSRPSSSHSSGSSSGGYPSAY
ncbi:MAG TPA: SUMF1/EgtB/PvdO family nonheme iron enzyme [Humisphaera sp.]